MQITIKFTNETARNTHYFLKKRYHSKHSKASFENLAKMAIFEIAAIEARLEQTKLETLSRSMIGRNEYLEKLNQIQKGD